MKDRYHVVIVGAGFAGLAAADTFTGLGLDTLIIDENIHTGGQLLRKMQNSRHPFANFDPDRMKGKGFSLIEKLKEGTQSPDRLHQAQVLGILSDRKLLIEIRDSEDFSPQGKKRVVEIAAEFIILATGARERYLPFKGWALPGIISSGAAQILMKSHGIFPGSNNLLAGSSPLMMVLATEILKHRGKVAALFDENSLAKQLRFLPLTFHHWPKLLEGAYYTSKILLKRTPIHYRFRVLEARGKNEFEAAVVAKTNSLGTVIPGTERIMTADALTVGYGFVPNVELPAQAGCKLEYQGNKGGWVVKVGEMGETSVPSIYAVGEITGIAGAKKSMIEGQLAALSILGKMDKVKHGCEKDQYFSKVQRLLTLDRRQYEYASFLGELCRVPLSAYEAIPDETIICRCEDITMGAIRKNINDGFDTLGSLKKASRSGMGRCQGRICSPVIFDIITALTSKQAEHIGSPQVRIPVKNVGVQSFLDG